MFGFFFLISMASFTPLAHFEIIERDDLNTINVNFEAIWIEIKNQNCKNVVVASIYRHPHDILDIYNRFLDYLESTLIKLTKENKELYVVISIAIC